MLSGITSSGMLYLRWHSRSSLARSFFSDVGLDRLPFQDDPVVARFQVHRDGGIVGNVLRLVVGTLAFEGERAPTSPSQIGKGEC
jgi:hypothetical protein